MDEDGIRGDIVDLAIHVKEPGTVSDRILGAYCIGSVQTMSDKNWRL